MTDSLRDKVAEAIHDHYPPYCNERDCQAGGYVGGWARHVADSAIAAIHPTITTIEQLDALPVGAIVKVGDEPGGIFEKDRSNNWGYDSGEDADLLISGSAACRESITVLWTPEAGQ